MSRPGLILAALLVASGLARAAAPEAADSLPRPNWDRQLAHAAAARARDDARVAQWLSLARSGDSGPLISALKAFAEAASPAAPAREADVLRFTVALGDLPPGDVPAGLLDVLEGWPVQTLVPHQENPAHAVPLYNIPAAARGARMALQRQAGRQQAAALLPQGPFAWLQGYRDAPPAQRRGFIDALDAAPAADRQAIAHAALAAASDPVVGAVAARAAPVLRDPDAVLHLLGVANTDTLAELLRTSAAQLSEPARATLLLGAISDVPPARAALAIALLAPGLAGRREVTDSLFDLLDDPELGASAALALARHPDEAVRGRLLDVSGGDGAAARRAGMALSLSSLPAAPRGRP